MQSSINRETERALYKLKCTFKEIFGDVTDTANLEAPSGGLKIAGEIEANNTIPNGVK